MPYQFQQSTPLNAFPAAAHLVKVRFHPNNSLLRFTCEWEMKAPQVPLSLRLPHIDR